MRPNGEPVRIQSLAKKEDRDFVIQKVSMLGANEPVSYERNESGLVIYPKLPEGTDLPICFKIELG